MPMRLQEFHPAVVHFPIALLPTAVAADAVGRLTGSQRLMDTGRLVGGAAAVSGAVAAATGFIAQEGVVTDDESHALLVTHRNLNAVVLAGMSLLAVSRARRQRPSVGQLLLGAATMGLASYTAYLGGRMVYAHGVGVEAAGGVLPDEAPEARLDQLAEPARTAAEQLAKGVAHSAEDLADGTVAPALGREA